MPAKKVRGRGDRTMPLTRACPWSRGHISWKMAAAVCVVGGRPLVMAKQAELVLHNVGHGLRVRRRADRQHQMVSVDLCELVVTQFRDGTRPSLSASRRLDS